MSALPEPRIEFEHGGARLRFFTPSSHTRWRAETLLTKEPDTIDWIGSFAPDDVLFDVGANVGGYTVFAAVTRGTRVVAFEPEAQNYTILNTNILINGIDARVSAYCVALSDAFAFDHLYLSSYLPGGSSHSFAPTGQDEGSPLSAAFRQGSIGFALDDLMDRSDLPFPTHIKIDVDGIEPRIIAGARRVLADPRLKSVLIETDTKRDDHWSMIDAMLELGFDYSQEQAEKARRASGPFEGLGNVIFRR